MKRDDRKPKQEQKASGRKIEGGRREPEPDGQVGDGADRDEQVDQRPGSIPDDGMLSGEVGK